METEFDGATESALSKMGASGARVLVTGGSGYLGSVLVEMLIQRGFKVTVADNLSYSQNTLFNLYHTGRLEFLLGDVTNEKFMAGLVGKGDFEFIFPLAAIVGFPVSEQKPELTWMVNHGAIVNMLKHRKPSQKIIFPTTNSGYGATTGEVHCTEETPLASLPTPVLVFSLPPCKRTID